MIGWIKKIFGSGVDLKAVLDKGATIIDVRTKGEFEAQHVKGAVHIALEQIETKVEDIKKMKQPVITYCNAGIKSGRAKNILVAKGIETYNGGGISSLNKLV